VSVAEFQAEARAVIATLRRDGVTPVLVGGSALYTRAVLDRFEFPGTDAAVRRRLEDELEATGPRPMHQRLAQQDPDAAERILPDNGRRIVRALEVIELTGRPFTASLPELTYADPATVQIGVDIDRETLDERIAARVAAMYDAGLVDEVAALVAEPGGLGRTAATAIGYREAAAHLRGELTLEEARERTTVATRRFARKQDAWFRKDPRVRWVRHDDPDRVARASRMVAETT
jgi:tRNA dimethylallyltransferase